MKPIKIPKSINDMDPTVRNIYDLLIAGNMSKKQIANACSVDLDIVHTVAKRFKTGQFKTDNNQNVPEETISEEINIASDNAQKNNRKKLSDDIILQIWELYSSNKKTKIEISEELQISYSSVCRYVNEYEESNNSRHLPKRKAPQRKVTPQKFSRYYNKYLNNEISRKEIMDKLDISNYTYHTYKKAYEESHKQKKNNPKVQETMETKPEEKIPVNEMVTKFELKPIKFSNNVVCGLINGRHDMPTDTFIFDSISSENMFNYDLQREICEKFITDNIEFKNGTACNTLIVYTTGLQCTLATLIKVTNEMKVNLIINHYNSDNGKYMSQTIWDSFGSVDEKYKFIENFVQNADRSLYTYDSTIEELMNQQEIYIISQSKMEHMTKKPLCRDRIFIKDYENLWDIYASAIKSINKNTKDLMSVNIYKAEKQPDGRFCQTSRICSFYNN